MNTKPFPFERLPHLSRRDVRLAQDVLGCLPRLGFSQKLSTHMSHLLTKELGESILIKREKIDLCVKDDLQKRLPPQGVFLTIGANPAIDKIVVELDPLLSFWSVDKLLGGPGELPQSLRTLTEIEEGVLSFLVLKVLALIFEKSGAETRFHFRLESVLNNSEAIESAIQEQTASFISLYFRITFGKKSGYIKIYLPESILDGVAHLENAESDQKYFQARIHNFEEIPSELWAEVGRVTLRGADINALESGDVILLDPNGLQLKGNRLSGVLPLRVGNGQQSQIKARILNDREKVSLRVEGISSGGSHV